MDVLKLLINKTFGLLGELIEPLKESMKESIFIAIFDIAEVICLVFIVYYLYCWMMNVKKGSTKLYFSTMAYIVFEMIIKARGG